MDEWLEQFLQHLHDTKAYAENTLTAYRVDLIQFHNFVTLARPNVMSWTRVDQALLLEYIIHLRERGYSPASLSRKVAALKRFFCFLQERRLITHDPTETLETPRVKRAPPRTLSNADVERLLNTLPDEETSKAQRDRALVEMLAATGLRVSELVALDVDDVNWETCAVRCRGEGAHARALPVRERAWNALVVYYRNARPQIIDGAAEQPALFLNLNGDRLTRQGLWVIVKACVQAADIDRAVTPYTLRHSFAMQLLREGHAVAQVQQMLGHSYKTTTQKYKPNEDEGDVKNGSIR